MHSSSPYPQPSSDAHNADPHRTSILALAWMMFLVPAIGATSPVLLQDTLKSTLVVFGVLGATLTFLQQRDRTSPLKWHPMVGFPVFLMLYALVSTAWGHTYLAIVEAVRWFIVSLLIWLMLNTLTPRNTPRLLWGIHGGALVASVWAVLQFLIDLQLFPQVAAPASTFINRNFFAEYAVSVIPLSIWLLLLQQKPAKAGILAASIGVNVAAIAMTSTRSALLAFILTTPLLAAAIWRFRCQMPFMQLTPSVRRSTWALMCAVVLVLCTLPSQSRLIGMNTNAIEKLGARAMDTLGAREYREGSSSVRLEMWAASARLLQEKWASGVGAGAWEAEIPTYQVVKGSAEIDPYAHNEYLQMLCEYGLIVGGTILAFSMAWLARSIAKVWAGSGLTDPQFGQRIFAPISACALATVAVVGFPFHLAPCTALLGIVMAIAGHSGVTVIDLRPTRFATAIFTILLSLALLVSLVIAGVAAYTERMYVLATAELIQAVNAPSERAERVASAKQRLSLAQSIQPNYPKLLLPAATVLIELGEWQAAKTAMQALAIARPQVADYWFSLAVLCAKLGEFPDSEYALNRLEALQPNGVRNVKARIDLLMRMQQYAQAKDVLQQYLVKWPSNTPIEPGLDLLVQKLNQY